MTVSPPISGTTESRSPDDHGVAPTALAVVGATRRFGDVRALDDIDLQVERREILALLGPSGCGKTTLLRSVAGLESLNAGEIHIHGRQVTRTPAQSRDVAMVFQDGALFPHLTVERNIRVAIDGGRRSARASTVERVQETAALLRIDHLLGRVPHQLSGGQRQRVGIARALVASPSLLLMDEPFASLDADLRLELRRELGRLHRQGALSDTVFVTHDQTEALGIADRIAVMFDGRIAQIGTPQALLDSPVSLAVAQFLGVPKINTVAVSRAHVLAFRPSDCAVRPGETNEGSVAVTGTVVAVEPFGGNWLTTIRSDSGNEIEGIIPWLDRPSIGDRPTLSCSRGSIHCFEAETGLRQELPNEYLVELWGEV